MNLPSLEPPTPNNDERTPMDWGYAVVFAALICLPMVGGLFGIGSLASNPEKRVLAPFPKVEPTREEIAKSGSDIRAYLGSLRSFPGEFNAYYDDHFGFRRSLIYAHSLLKYFWLGISPIATVVSGKDDWLFYNAQGNIENYRGTRLFDDVELERWGRRFAQTQEWLDDRGVAYLLVISPSKTTIYPEYLPDWVRKVSDRTRFDQLQGYLEAETSVDLLDMRPALLASKERERSYLQFDSHWSMYGGFVAYRAVAEKLRERFPEIELLEEDDFRFVSKERPGGDLATILHLYDDLSEVEAKLEWKDELAYEWSVGFDLLAPELPDRKVNELREHPSVTVHRERQDLPEILMFHDSFGPLMSRYLADATRRGVFYWQLPVNPEVVDKETPDIVLQEIGERLLMMRRIGKTNHEITRNFELRRRFRSFDEVLGRLEGTFLGPGETVLEVPIDLSVPRDIVLRIDLDCGGPGLLRVLRGKGAHEALRRNLTLSREIDYVELYGLKSTEPVRVVLQNPSGAPSSVRSIEVRAARDDGP